MAKVTGKLSHRGRFQAQGTGLEKSSPWSQSVPLTIGDGNLLLTDLKNKLTPTEYSERSLGFYECSKHINEVHKSGGYSEHISKHFPKLVRPGGKRIDLEVKAGIAFV
jgi:hypothetical protein